MNQAPDRRQPTFGFQVPKGYMWLLERGLIGFDPFGPLQPWHYLPRENAIDVHEIWRRLSVYPVVAFAKRQDCDDYACFEIKGNRVSKIVEIEGSTSSGYTVLQEHATFWSWVKSIIDDIAECVDNED
jgi:hypothetical protein